MAEIVWTPERGGQYQIEASGSDENGNEVSSVTYVWAGGAGDGSGDGTGEFVSWRRENNDRIELVADKAEYAPGDTARILVPSPFSGPVDALVTIERDGVIESQIVTLDSNSELIDIPITADHIPNVYASVVLVKGVDETNPTPALRIGYVELPVDVSQKELAIDIEPSAEQVRPGETVSYTLTVDRLRRQPGGRRRGVGGAGRQGRALALRRRAPVPGRCLLLSARPGRADRRAADHQQ